MNSQMKEELFTSDMLMKMAIEEAKNGILSRNGGPFGSIIFKDGKIIGKGSNRVIIDNDPTAHGEIVAIRDACKALGTHNLSGATLYTTCYPCPMCACACLWAGISTIIYGCTSKDAKAIGFNDEIYYEELQNSINKLLVQARAEDVEACEELFEEYIATGPELY